MGRVSMKQAFSSLVIAVVMSAMGCIAASDDAGHSPAASHAQPIDPVDQVSREDVSTTSTDSLAAECTPGDVRSCCPFSNGCGCVGDQSCDATGTWGTCRGARPHPKGCP